NSIMQTELKNDNGENLKGIQQIPPPPPPRHPKKKKVKDGSSDSN
ncbi:unnamed protein product, partial [marine sediment metagenome]